MFKESAPSCHDEEACSRERHVYTSKNIYLKKKHHFFGVLLQDLYHILYK